MAKVLRLHEYTGVDGIRLDDIPVGEPGWNEVRINVDAFSLNYGDFELFENKVRIFDGFTGAFRR